MMWCRHDEITDQQPPVDTVGVAAFPMSSLIDESFYESIREQYGKKRNPTIVQSFKSLSSGNLT